MTGSDHSASAVDGGEPSGDARPGTWSPARDVPVPIDNCTIARTLATLGEKWTFLILRDAFRGARRFEEFLSQTAIPRQVLSNRLAVLTEQGILRKQMYQEPGSRARAEYLLTDKGTDTFPIIVAMRQWGDRYQADPAGPPLASLHEGCGATVSVQMRCADGHEVASGAEVVHRLEPAALRRNAG